MATQEKVRVSEAAIMARINRKLAVSGKTLKRCRADSHAHADLGDFYTIDKHQNCVTAKHCDLAAVATGCGVLKAWEEVAA
jgi:hypothetical protein